MNGDLSGDFELRNINKRNFAFIHQTFAGRCGISKPHFNLSCLLLCLSNSEKEFQSADLES